MDFITQQNDVASRLKLAIGQADNATLIKRWLNQSQQEIWNRNDWHWARERALLQPVADKTAGTVSVNSSATAVTGVSTAFASADVGKFIQFGGSNDWYKITAAASSTSLTIEAGYSGASNLSAGTYTIRQVYYSLGSTVEKILDARQWQSPAYMDVMHFRDFDSRRPHATATGKATVMIVWGFDASGNLMVMPYPFADATYNIELRFKKKVVDLSADADVSIIPIKWHSTVMIDGALYRGFEYIGAESPNDAREARKKAEFESGIQLMLAEDVPDGDYHPVIRSLEANRWIANRPRLPARYGLE